MRYKNELHSLPCLPGFTTTRPNVFAFGLSLKTYRANHSRFGALICLMLITALVFSDVYAEAAQNKPGQSDLSSMACSGKAPMGEFHFSKIVGTESKRTEGGLYEGPAWLNGSLYFSEFSFSTGFPSKINVLNAQHKLSTWQEDAGSNGLTAGNGKNGEPYILIASHKEKSIVRLNVKTKATEKLINGFEGKPFNSPNDLVTTRTGDIYFTDPRFQQGDQTNGQAVTGVYRLAADGSVMLIDGSIQNPNGIALSPDESWLYVSGGGEKGYIKRYAITDNMDAIQSSFFVPQLNIPDGLTVDCLGNLYATEHVLGRVTVYDPSGMLIAFATLPEHVTNLSFGGEDGKTLFLTAARTIYKATLNVNGAR